MGRWSRSSARPAPPALPASLPAAVAPQGAVGERAVLARLRAGDLDGARVIAGADAALQVFLCSALLRAGRCRTAAACLLAALAAAGEPPHARLGGAVSLADVRAAAAAPSSPRPPCRTRSPLSAAPTAACTR